MWLGIQRDQLALQFYYKLNSNIKNPAYNTVFNNTNPLFQRDRHTDRRSDSNETALADELRHLELVPCIIGIDMPSMSGKEPSYYSMKLVQRPLTDSLLKEKWRRSYKLPLRHNWVSVVIVTITAVCFSHMTDNADQMTVVFYGKFST